MGQEKSTDRDERRKYFPLLWDFGRIADDLRRGPLSSNQCGVLVPDDLEQMLELVERAKSLLPDVPTASLYKLPWALLGNADYHFWERPGGYRIVAEVIRDFAPQFGIKFPERVRDHHLLAAGAIYWCAEAFDVLVGVSAAMAEMLPYPYPEFRRLFLQVDLDLHEAVELRREHDRIIAQISDATGMVEHLGAFSRARLAAERRMREAVEESMQEDLNAESVDHRLDLEAARRRAKQEEREIERDKKRFALSQRVDQKQRREFLAWARDLVNRGTEIRNLGVLKAAAGFQSSWDKRSDPCLKSWAKEAGLKLQAGRPPAGKKTVTTRVK